jgi:hypothetical protein
MFPNGAVRHPNGHPIGYVTYAKSTKETRFTIPGTKIETDAGNEAMIFTTSSTGDNTAMVMAYDLESWNEARPPVADDELAEFRNIGSASEEQRLQDISVTARLARIAMNAILLLNVRPEMAEVGARVERSGKTKKGAHVPEVWTPNWLGRTYRTPGRTADSTTEKGTHASPRLHWRRGHWRDQRVGAGRKESKTIWIEPVVVNAKTEEVAL